MESQKLAQTERSDGKSAKSPAHEAHHGDVDREASMGTWIEKPHEANHEQEQFVPAFYDIDPRGMQVACVACLSQSHSSSAYKLL